MSARILVLDNYDSFVYNLVQYLGELGAEPAVFRNDALDLDAVRSFRPDGVLISPGPGRPSDAGVSSQVIADLADDIPILGVCLGHQCIGQVFGAEVVRAATIMHGKTSIVHHDGQASLAGLPDPFEATRYHSLIVDRATVPPVLEISAWTDEGTIMGLRHRERPIEGVQFHPESILTAAGHQLMGNWLARCAAPAGR